MCTAAVAQGHPSVRTRAFRGFPSEVLRRRGVAPVRRLPAPLFSLVDAASPLITLPDLFPQHSLSVQPRTPLLRAHRFSEVARAKNRGEPHPHLPLCHSSSYPDFDSPILLPQSPNRHLPLPPTLILPSGDFPRAEADPSHLTPAAPSVSPALLASLPTTNNPPYQTPGHSPPPPPPLRTTRPAAPPSKQHGTQPSPLAQPLFPLGSDSPNLFLESHTAYDPFSFPTSPTIQVRVEAESRSGRKTPSWLFGE